MDISGCNVALTCGVGDTAANSDPVGFLQEQPVKRLKLRLAIKMVRISFFIRSFLSFVAYIIS